MRKTLFLVLILAVLVMAGCGGANAEPEATYTPFPTYTPLPTYTPFPTPTATFLPPPTEPVTPTQDLGGSPSDEGEPAELPTETPSGLQVFLAFGSNLREGPGKEFDVITRLSAGDALLILGRDLNGFWAFVRSSSGLEGWVAFTQIQGPLDIPRIPLADDIPEPDITFTPKPSGTADGTTTGTPGTPDPDAKTATPDGTTTPSTPTTVPSAPGAYEVVAGAPQECVTLVAPVPAPFPVDSVGQILPAFDAANSGSIVSQRAFRFFRNDVPDFIDVKVVGDVTPVSCDSTTNTCEGLSFEICYSSPADAPTGGTDYAQNVIIAVGVQSYDQFYEDVRTFIWMVFTVVAP